MRKLFDKNKHKLQVDEIKAVDAYHGLLEGSPYLVRKLRLMKAKRFNEQEGNIFDSVEQLEQESANCERGSDDWPANEYWVAQISDGVRYAGGDTFTSNRMSIAWYQEGGDPFERLNRIVAAIEFNKLCRQEAWKA